MRRQLLEWSAYDDRQAAPDLAGSIRSMWSATFFACLAAIGLAVWKPAALPAALPVLLLWLAAPVLAWWISRPLVRRAAELTREQTVFLRRIARKTWAYFEQFVVAEDHWLPPDNFQEHPGPAIAHRTSPTNIGLAQLACLAAADFGYISTGSLIERTSNAFQSMASLQRHHGHFYNWYDTQTLQPLAPRYISSVDSGNLAAHLLTLRAGLLALPDQRIVSARVFEGLADTLALLPDVTPEPDQEAVRGLRSLLYAVSASPGTKLPAIRQQLATVADATTALAVAWSGAAEDEATAWIAALARQSRDALDDLRFLAPWLEEPATPANALAELDGIPTLRQLAAAGIERAVARISELEKLAQQASEFATANYEFLYDRTRHLLAIGYNVDDHRRDTSYYDLLASEARLCTFVAIAQGQLPQESWFALGRLLTTAGGEPVLVSWSGSMFEYLMPLLVMPTYQGTLLDQTCRAAVARQIAYGHQRSLPWGVSESGYNTVDANLNYQYHAFGVPGLGLTRGLAEDLVVAPYASALALMVEPEAACQNLARLARTRARGPLRIL